MHYDAQKNLAALIESTEDAIWSVDLDFRLLTFNQAFVRNLASIFNVTPVVGMAVEDALPSVLASSWRALYESALREGAFLIEYPLADGRVLELSLNPMVVEGERTGVSAFAKDISEQKRQEAERMACDHGLRASEERYRNVIDLSPDAIFVGRKKKIVITNKAAVELFGVATAKNLIGRSFSELVCERDRALVCEMLKGLYEDERQIPLQEGKIRREDGRLVDVEVSARSFFEDGEMVVQAVVRDISARKVAETEHVRLVRGIEQIDEAVVISDINGTIVYVNPAFERMTGYGQVIGQKLSMLRSGRHPESLYQTMVETLLRGETWSGELISRRKDGTEYTVAVTVSPVRDASGAVVNFVSVHRDRTQELLLRKQLNQAQKMEAVGRLAGGVAHDFNNLMMVVRTYAELLEDRLPEEDTLRFATEQILKAVERGSSLTRQMLAFSRKQITSPVELNLNEVIEETATMLQRILGEDVEFRVALKAPLWTVRADADQMVQILMNLCVNARDAMVQGGRLMIETENVTVAEGSIDERGSVLPGDYVRLSVSDSGVGMSQEIQRGVFEPFFTTKEVGKGTGLGLSTIYGIVKQSGGHVWVESQPGKGACFTIYLPRIERAPLLAMPAVAKDPPRGSETILVVEDEDSLRRGICSLLSNLGYRVLSAGSGEEALAISGEQNAIHLLLTDVVMPQMSGRELAQILSKLRPEMKIIYMSGYTDDAALRYGIHELRTAFLQKPFGLGALAHKLRDTLGQSAIVQ